MSAPHEHDFPKTTVSQFLLALGGALLTPLLVIFLIAKLVLGIQATHIADADPAVAAAKVVERIQPVGQVVLAGAGGPHIDKSGEQVVKEVCAMCHAAGLLGSPKIGDKGAWAPRLSQGYETLVKHALQGIRQMPARGGVADLSDAEVAAAVAYMANQSGADFKAPGAKPEATAAEAAPVAK